MLDFRQVFFGLNMEKQLYFLHINKTGGTYVEDVLSRKKNIVKVLGHHSNILDIPKEGFIFFTLRDPFEKMCSSAYQLFRSGDIFKNLITFDGAEDYIKCLCNANSSKHQLAINIHNTHPHLSKSYWSFFISEDYMHAYTPRILMAIRTERLTVDLPRLFSDLSIDINESIVFDKTSKLNRSSSVENYAEYFGKEVYESYAKINSLEFKFYNSALKFTIFDDRYSMTLQRYLNEL
jgi:hypothetical protein